MSRPILPQGRAGVVRVRHDCRATCRYCPAVHEAELTRAADFPRMLYELGWVRATNGLWTCVRCVGRGRPANGPPPPSRPAPENVMVNEFTQIPRPVSECRG